MHAYIIDMSKASDTIYKGISDILYNISFFSHIISECVLEGVQRLELLQFAGDDKSSLRQIPTSLFR